MENSNSLRDKKDKSISNYIDEINELELKVEGMGELLNMKDLSNNG